MAKVKLSKDGSSINFVQTESIPTSLKKFRRSPEIEDFYRFIYENLLQREAFEIVNKIYLVRKKEELEAKKAARAEKRAQKALEKSAGAKSKTKAKSKSKAKTKAKKK